MHRTSPEILPRLKRAEGHLRGVIGMIEANKPCLDVAQQLSAVEAAIARARQALIHDHIEHCLEDADASATLRELKQLARLL